ncbi:lipocalin family protein [Sulfitobacter sp.]|uniref:lipocalin family protein n=1 Tax=Sulfitobacter sp. TaxID=1903071 RepID=UPI0039E21414
MKRALLALILLAGCGAQVPSLTEGYRDQSALIGSTSRYDAARFKGAWVMRGSFDADAPATVAFVDSTGGPAFQFCDGAGICDGVWLATSTGQGRYALTRPDGGTREFWVLWVDEGFRTAVVGNPAGDFGWILDRKPTGGADRITAAQEILDFNGYDISQLRMRK